MQHYCYSNLHFSSFSALAALSSFVSPPRVSGAGIASSPHLLFRNNSSINFIFLLLGLSRITHGKVPSISTGSFQMETKINLYREARCSLFLSISTCLFTETSLINRDFTHLVKALWSHQDVGTDICQPTNSSSPAAIQCWPSKIPEWRAAASAAQAVAQSSRRAKSLPWSPKPTACGGLAITWDGEGVAGTKLSVGWRTYLRGRYPTRAMLAPGTAIFLLPAPCPLQPQ